MTLSSAENKRKYFEKYPSFAIVAFFFFPHTHGCDAFVCNFHKHNCFQLFHFILFFITVWFYFGIVGSFMFILIQLILLIDFAHSWNEVWVRNAEEGNNKCWFSGM